MSAPLVRRELRARPGRLALVLMTVIVAVGFTTGAFGFASQVRSLVSSPLDRGALLLPEGEVVLTSSTDALTTPTALDERLLATVQSVPGVLQARGDYDQPVSFVLPRGSQPERPAALRGVVLSSTADAARWSILSGRFPNGPEEIALDAGGLTVAATSPGGEALLQLPVGTIRVRIVGVVAPLGTSTPPTKSAAAVALSSAHAVLDKEWAPRMLDAVGRTDRIDVIPQPRVAPELLASRIRRAVPDGVTVLATTNRAARSQHTVEAINGDVESATLAYAALTVLVAVLVIANTTSVIVAQRTRELGLLRLLGASRRQVAGTVVGESAVVGVVGSVAGALLGVVLAHTAGRIVRTGSAPVSFELTSTMALVALLVGMSTAMLGGLWPAWRAGRVPPLAALSDTRAGADHQGRVRWPALLLLIGLATVAWAASGTRGDLDRTRITIGTTGALAGFVGLALLSRLVVVPVSALVGRPLTALFGVSARLGVGNARRQPSRTAGAASTLIVGLALVAMTATFGASARAAIQTQVGQAGAAGLYVERRGVVRVSTGAVLELLRRRSRGIAEIATVGTLDGFIVGRRGATSPASVADLSTLAGVIDLGLVGLALRDGAGPAGTLLATGTAKELGVSVGDTVNLRSISGEERTLTVIGTYRNTALAGPALVPLDIARDIRADGTFEVAAIRLRPGAPAFWVQRRVSRTMGFLPRMRVSTPVQFAALSTSVADAAVRIVSVMLVGALGIGLLGLAATLALSTLERRRELVMLRAVGAGRTQIQALVWLEATMIGFIAAIVGIGAGTAVARLATGFAPGSLGGSPVVPWGQLVAVAVGAVLTAWAVSLGIARRAAQVPPAEAGRL